MEINKINNLSFYNDQGVLTIPAKQYDTGRKFTFNIIADDEPFDLSDCMVYLRILKADGTQFQGHECCSVDVSHIIVDTSVGNGSQILTSAGINICELHLEDVNGISLTTWNFNILVEPRVHDGSHISSVDSYDVLDIAKRNEEARQKNEEIRLENETQRQENEIQRQENEIQRQENEKTRKNKFEIFESKIGEITDEAKSYAAQAQSWTVGGTNTRTGEDTDNSKHYYEQIKSIAESFSGTLRPKGTIAFASLPSLSSAKEGDMYNISNQFTTNTDFKEGSGHIIPAGSNIYKTADGKWDVLAGTPVTGVKGDKENTYRRGNVNITAANVGALSDNGTAVAAKKLETSRNISLSGDVTGGTAFDGTASKTITATLANSGVAAGDYGALELVKRNDGSVWVSNNAGLHGTSAISTWTAKQDCNISFNWKVSSESASYDYLNITAAGTQILANTGGTAEQTGDLTAVLKKDQSIKFTYRKDSSANNGADRAEIFGMKYGTGTNTPNTVVYESNVGNYFTITNSEYGFYPGTPQMQITVDEKGRITKEQTVYMPKGITNTATANRDGLMGVNDKKKLDGLNNIVYTENDFNNCNDTGFYTLSGTVYNSPDGTTTGRQWGCITTCSKLDCDEHTQIAFDVDNYKPMLYIRGKYEYDNDGDDEWEYGPWRSIPHKEYNDSLYASKSIYGDTVVSMGRREGTIVGENSFAFGWHVIASADNSVAFGNQAKATHGAAFASGFNTSASHYNTHAEGNSTTASNQNAHAEGGGTTASGYNSHAEGCRTTASGTQSHAEGYCTLSNNTSSSACGQYNKGMMTGGGYNGQIGDAFVVGNGYAGSSTADRSSATLSNALRITYTGEIYGTKAFKSSGADYAEHIKEWADGNPDNEDRVGYLVTIKNGLLYKANEGDYIAGITSGNPSVVGNADEDYYWKYERDAFNRIVMEDVPEVIQQTDKDGNPMFDEETHEPIMIETGNIIHNARMKLAEGYDSSLQENYVERKDRKEWDYVGMVGVLPVRDDGTCLPDHFCKCGQDGIATLTTEREYDTFYVIERISENIVSVELR